MHYISSLAVLVTTASIQGGALLASGLPSGKPQVSAPKITPKMAPLAVGDPAPTLGKLVFLKGEPIHELESGKLYLIEFWATWCTACKMLVPHLSQVARDYRDKVTVISVDVAEQGNEGKPYSIHLPRLQRFMENGGKAMDYTVAMDDDDRTMMKTWLDRSGGGFPSAILVDRTGRIAWMGFPGETLPAVLDLAIENKLDSAAIKRLKERQEEVQKDSREFAGRINNLAKMEKFSEALELVDGRIALKHKQGVSHSDLLLYKYMLLTFLDPAEARKFGEAFLAQHENLPVYLSFFAFSLVSGYPTCGDKYAYQDCELALKAAQMAHAKGDSRSPLVLRDLAQGYALMKDYRNAVKYQELAIESLSDYGGGGQKKGMMQILSGFRTKLKATTKP